MTTTPCEELDKKKILILEDAQYRIEAFIENIEKKLGHILIITSHVEDCINILKTHEIDILSLDHDLNGHIHVESGGKEETGYDVALFLNQNPQYIPKKVILHSKYELGRKKMKELLPESEYVKHAWENADNYA
jgi:CheY-like chemotaxis protein